MLAAADTASPQAKKRTRYYVLQQYFMQHGTQLARCHDFFSKGLVTALDKAHAGPKIVLEALVAPHMPQVAFLAGFESFEQLNAIHEKIFADKDLAKAFDTWESEIGRAHV